MGMVTFVSDVFTGSTYIHCKCMYVDPVRHVAYIVICKKIDIVAVSCHEIKS